MITVEEYCKVLEEAESKVKDFDRRIAYRKIELIGASANKSFELNGVNYISTLQPSPIIDEEQRVLNNDLTLANLLYEKQKYQEKIDFIRKHAEYPTEEE